MSGILLVNLSGPILAQNITQILLAQGSGFDSNPDIALNTTHRLGDGSDHADVASNNAHRADVLSNPHAVTAAQVAEDVYDNGVITVDTVLDWNNGQVQVVTMGAVSNLSFTGWEALAPVDDGKVQSGTLIIVDGDLFAPTFDDFNQGPLPTYTAGFACVQELASLGPDGAIYNMFQVSNDQHVLLGPELIDDPFFGGSIGTTWNDNGGGAMSIVNNQLIANRDVSQVKFTETNPFVTATFEKILVELDIASNTFNGDFFFYVGGSPKLLPQGTTGVLRLLFHSADATGIRGDSFIFVTSGTCVFNKISARKAL